MNRVIDRVVVSGVVVREAAHGVVDAAGEGARGLARQPPQRRHRVAAAAPARTRRHSWRAFRTNTIHIMVI